VLHRRFGSGLRQWFIVTDGARVENDDNRGWGNTEDVLGVVGGGTVDIAADYDHRI
jgi:hypothetical protein